MVPDKFNMIDMEGIDIITSQGEEIPGLYQKLVESIAQCRYQCIYNWKFDGILIPPTYVEMTVIDDVVWINEGVSVDEEDVIRIYSLEPQVVIEELEVTENGTYNAPSGVDGFNPVTVNISTGAQGVYKSSLPPDNNIGVDGEFYIQEIVLPSNVNFVDFIKSTGTQYIQTDFYADQDTEALISYEVESTTDGYVFGARTARSSNAFGIVPQSSRDVRFDFGNRDESPFRYTAGVRIDNVLARLSLQTKTLFGAHFSATFTTPSKLAIFACNSNGSILNNSGIKVSRFVLKQSGVIVGDYLAALDDQDVPCMYEAVSGEYVYNSGTGDFSSGISSIPSNSFSVFRKENGVWVNIPQTSAIT